MKRIFYCTRDITPTDQFHFLLEGMKPDMETPLALRAQIVSPQMAKMCREHHGKDCVASFLVPTLYGPEFNELTTRVHNGANMLSITRFYKPALGAK